MGYINVQRDTEKGLILKPFKPNITSTYVAGPFSTDIAYTYDTDGYFDFSQPLSSIEIGLKFKPQGWNQTWTTLFQLENLVVINLLRGYELGFYNPYDGDGNGRVTISSNDFTWVKFELDSSYNGVLSYSTDGSTYTTIRTATPAGKDISQWETDFIVGNNKGNGTEPLYGLIDLTECYISFNGKRLDFVKGASNNNGSANTGLGNGGYI